MKEGTCCRPVATWCQLIRYIMCNCSEIPGGFSFSVNARLRVLQRLAFESKVGVVALGKGLLCKNRSPGVSLKPASLQDRNQGSRQLACL